MSIRHSLATLFPLLFWGPFCGLLCSGIPSSACTVVNGERIRGADLAAENTNFLSLDPAANLGPTPAAGSRRTFFAFELERIAKEHALTLPPNTRREACFERATMTLDEAMLQDILRTALDSQPRTEGATLEIADFSRNLLPAGTPEFTPEGLDKSGLWRGRLTYGSNRSVPIWARVRVMRAGVGKDGTVPIAQWRHPEEPGIQRGNTVQVEVWSGAVRIAFEAIAESSAQVGEQVTVRNPANGQKFRGLVEDRGKVEIRK